MTQNSDSSGCCSTSQNNKSEQHEKHTFSELSWVPQTMLLNELIIMHSKTSSEMTLNHPTVDNRRTAALKTSFDSANLPQGYSRQQMGAPCISFQLAVEQRPPAVNFTLEIKEICKSKTSTEFGSRVNHRTVWKPTFTKHEMYVEYADCLPSLLEHKNEETSVLLFIELSARSIKLKSLVGKFCHLCAQNKSFD